MRRDSPAKRAFVLAARSREESSSRGRAIRCWRSRSRTTAASRRSSQPQLLSPWRTTRPASDPRTLAFEIATARRGRSSLLLPCPPAARDVCAAPLAPGHPRRGGQALDRSAAAEALPLEPAALPLETDFELRRLSHGPGDATISRPTTRRVVVVHCRHHMSRLAGSCFPSQNKCRGPALNHYQRIAVP